MRDQTSPSETTQYQIDGRAFLPGEDVGVTVLLRNDTADRYGEIRVLIDATELPPGCEGVVLFGHESGTLYFEDPR